MNGACRSSCTSEIRCGADLETCCDAGELCIGESCEPLGADCADSFDCEDGEYCEPMSDACFADPGSGICEVQPEVGPLQLTLDWSVEVDQLESLPVVADVDADGVPEVLLSTRNATDPGGANAVFYGHVVILDGQTGTQQVRVTEDVGTFGSYARSTMGVADVDGNGVPDVVYAGRPEVGIAPFANNSSRIHAVDGLGALLWSSRAGDGSPYFVYIRNGAVTFANFDSDPQSEIVVGTTVLDHDGVVVFDQDNEWARGGGAFGSNGNLLGGVAVTADLTGNGTPEIISGRQAWTVSWTEPPVGAPVVSLSLLWEHIGPDGYPAVADLDGDGFPEVVLVGDPEPFTDPDGGGPLSFDGQVRVLDGSTGELWCGVDSTGAACAGNDALRTQPLPLQGGGRGGPPVLADVDGDGRLEIAVGGRDTVAVYDLARAGEDIVQPAGDPIPSTGDIYRRWSASVRDTSATTGGLSAFDFEGDGAQELLHQGECYTRVFDGSSGATRLQLESSSTGNLGYPLVADVDADDHAELIVVTSDETAAADCADIPGYTARQGIFVYSDSDNAWPRTRSVWNQHA